MDEAGVQAFAGGGTRSLGAMVDFVGLFGINNSIMLISHYEHRNTKRPFMELQKPGSNPDDGTLHCARSIAFGHWQLGCRAGD